MIVYYLYKASDKLKDYPFPIKEGDICMLYDGEFVKTVYINNIVEADSIWRDYRFIDSKSLRSYHLPKKDTVLCAPYDDGHCEGDPHLLLQLSKECTGEWLQDFLDNTNSVLSGIHEYWDLSVLRRITGNGNIVQKLEPCPASDNQAQGENNISSLISSQLADFALGVLALYEHQINDKKYAITTSLLNGESCESVARKYDQSQEFITQTFGEIIKECQAKIGSDSTRLKELLKQNSELSFSYQRLEREIDKLRKKSESVNSINSANASSSRDRETAKETTQQEHSSENEITAPSELGIWEAFLNSHLNNIFASNLIKSGIRKTVVSSQLNHFRYKIKAADAHPTFGKLLRECKSFEECQRILVQLIDSWGYERRFSWRNQFVMDYLSFLKERYDKYGNFSYRNHEISKPEVDKLSKPKPENSLSTDGLPWTKAQEEEAIRYYESGHSIRSIAFALKRTEAAVNVRLHQLLKKKKLNGNSSKSGEIETVTGIKGHKFSDSQIDGIWDAFKNSTLQKEYADQLIKAGNTKSMVHSQLAVLKSIVEAADTDASFGARLSGCKSFKTCKEILVNLMSAWGGTSQWFSKRKDFFLGYLVFLQKKYEEYGSFDQEKGHVLQKVKEEPPLRSFNTFYAKKSAQKKVVTDESTAHRQGSNHTTGWKVELTYRNGEKKVMTPSDALKTVVNAVGPEAVNGMRLKSGDTRLIRFGKPSESRFYEPVNNGYWLKLYGSVKDRFELIEKIVSKYSFPITSVRLV